jgi:hypothetical protein
MLDMARSSFHDASEFPLANLVTRIEEGTPVMQVIEGGVAKIKAAASANTDIFAGVALQQYVTPTTGVYVETVTVPSSSPYTVTLKKSAVVPATDSLAKLVVAGTALTWQGTVGSVAASEYNITDSTVTFHSAQAGLKVTVTYRYTLSVNDVYALYGDSWPGNNNAGVIGNVGVIRKGLVFTDKFDASKDWSAVNGSTVIKATAGLFSFGGNGATVPGKVESVPNADVPFLGIRINA